MATTNIVATEVCKFQKDRVEQARCNFLLQHSKDISAADILAVKVNNFGRMVMRRPGAESNVLAQGAAYSYAIFTIRYTLKWRGRLLTTILSFTILYELTLRRSLLTAI